METMFINSENLIDWQSKIPNHVIALGFFDGLHKGHKSVILEAKKVANEKGLPLSVMSFFPHPKSVLSNGRIEVDYLMPLEEKQKQLASLGVDYFMIVEFTLDFASLSPEQFVQDYVLGLGATHVVCGFDYTYGKKGTGNASTLIEHGKGMLGVTVVPKVAIRGEKVSSTRIRELLSQGDVSFITQLIGKPYSVEWCPENGLLPYYTLPRPGRYEATIVSKSVTTTTVLQVLNNAQIDFGSTFVPTNESITISWLRELSDEKYRATS